MASEWGGPSQAAGQRSGACKSAMLHVRGVRLSGWRTDRVRMPDAASVWRTRRLRQGAISEAVSDRGVVATGGGEYISDRACTAAAPVIRAGHQRARRQSMEHDARDRA